MLIAKNEEAKKEVTNLLSGVLGHNNAGYKVVHEGVPAYSTAKYEITLEREEDEARVKVTISGEDKWTNNEEELAAARTRTRMMLFFGGMSHALSEEATNEVLALLQAKGTESFQMGEMGGDEPDPITVQMHDDDMEIEFRLGMCLTNEEVD